MEHALAVADAAIARAGASTIAELLASGIYALYVPLPSAIYDHQRLNAEQVVRAGAGRMVLESELSPLRLRAEIHDVLAGAVANRSNVARLGEVHRHAAERLADEILSLRETKS
jgi:UDP-N-acetylglucosamine--N-acetylmuramyl-(pentapeptide) pyrophosphoryl-undecaprenol N-acetylglucosamine transferase